MNKRHFYSLIIISLILLFSYSQGDYVFAQSSSLEEQQTENASDDEINEMQNQEPTETRDGGEYSGFEETGVQTEGIPEEGAESTPEAPVSGLEVRDPTDEGTSPFNVTNATGRSFNQTDNNTTTANTASQANNQAEENSSNSNPIMDTLQKINPFK
jgi:hypothetical protein